MHQKRKNSNIIYRKLVRDKIPEIIKKQGKLPFTRKIDNHEYRKAVGRKILEEEDDYQLRERQTGYYDWAQFNSSNSFYWDLDHKPADPHIP